MVMQVWLLLALRGTGCRSAGGKYGGRRWSQMSAMILMVPGLPRRPVVRVVSRGRNVQRGDEEEIEGECKEVTTGDTRMYTGSGFGALRLVWGDGGCFELPKNEEQAIQWPEPVGRARGA